MVGLKTVWITIIGLLLMASCVPQTKQTECRTNEAFNASLRSCVPVIGGPTSFIKIGTYSPALPISVYKNDSTIFQLTVTIDNPYAQNYTIEWVREHMGQNSFYAGNTLSTTMVPLSLASELGVHTIIAKIIADGKVVDSHSFTVTVTDLPRPSIDAVSITPSDYAVTFTPIDTAQDFTFNVKNNNSVISGAGYKVNWTVTKNNVNLPSLQETDAFGIVTPSGTNSFQLGTSSLPTFDPGASGMGVGTYVVKAIVQNTVPGEVVGVAQWSVTVKHPDLGKVQSVSSPATSVATTAYHGLNYTQFPTYNWTMPGGLQPNYCLTIDDADGTYSSDGMGVQVKYYINGIGGDICTKETNDGGSANQTICLNDANRCDDGTPYPFAPTSLFNTSVLALANSSALVTQNHKITARIIDKATGLEYAASNVNPSIGLYPIEWNVVNKPVNAAPALAFGTTQPTDCTSSGAFSKINCAVTQGTSFNISFTVTDDFYNPLTAPNQFQYTAKLKYGTLDLTGTGTSCTRNLGDGTLNYTAGIGWICALTVPHHFNNVPLHPLSGPYQIVVELLDSGSPVGGSALAAFPLTWNLNVTESNNTVVAYTHPPLPVENQNIHLNPQTDQANDSHISRTSPLPATYHTIANALPVTELETINFNLNVTDPELDDFKYRVSLCTDNTSSCLTSTPISANPAPPFGPYLPYVRNNSVIPTAGNYQQVNGLAYTIPEDLLINTLNLNVNTSAAQNVYFKVEVSDVPSVIATVNTSTKIYGVQILNLNPAPVISTATANPLEGTTKIVMSGLPLSIFPGDVTDTSGPAKEKDLKYQWYASADAGTTYSLIPGATEKTLLYTPDSGSPLTGITLKLCVSDNTAANPIANPNAGGNCTATGWTILPRDNVITHSSSVMNNEMAVWYDDQDYLTDATRRVAYTAFIGTDKRIYVNKTILNLNVTTGDKYLLDSSTETIVFDATTAAVGNVSSISITGTAKSLYIAYLASTVSTSSSMNPRLRRIEKDFGGAVGTRTSTTHGGKFGFLYAGYSISATCVGCSVIADVKDTARIIQFTNGLANGQILSINGIVFEAVAAPSDPEHICSNGSCPDGDDVATNLAAKINAHTDPALQGITAVPSANTVVLYGLYENDSLDWDGSSAPSSVGLDGAMGKIFIVGSRWFIPFANSSLSGPQQNNINVISGTVDNHLRNLVGRDDNEVLTEIGKVSALDHDINSDGELVVASISGEVTTAGYLNLHKFNLPIGTDWQPVGAPSNKLSLFNSRHFKEIKLAVSRVGNPYFYVLAKEVTTDDYFMGRHSKLFSGIPSEEDLSNRLDSTDLTSSMILDAGNPTRMKGATIQAMPNTSEARLLFSSIGAGATNYPRMARWRSTNIISCGNCEPIGKAASSTASIGMTRIVTKAEANHFAIGENGFTANESKKDLFFTIFSSFNGATYEPQVGVFNAETESIQSTTRDTTNHLWRPPFVK